MFLWVKCKWGICVTGNKSAALLNISKSEIETKKSKASFVTVAPSSLYALSPLSFSSLPFLCYTLHTLLSSVNVSYPACSLRQDK